MVSIAIKLVFLTLLISPQFVQNGTFELVKQVVSNIVKSIPQLENEVASSPKNEVVTAIISSGFKTFYQSADVTQYSRVKDEHIFPFLEHLKRITKLPQKYEEYFVENLSMVLYSDFNELIVFNIMFDVGSGGDCKYICVIGNRDMENGTTDFLVGDVTSRFTLANNIMIVNETRTGLFGIINFSSNKIIETAPTITNEQIATLFKYFTVCIFKRFSEILNLGQNYLSLDGFLQ
jgi:hypothetical protein